MDELSTIQSKAEDLKALYSGREELFSDVEDMYFMQWNEGDAAKRRQQNVKLTLSPDARNQLLGAVRLMSATDPIWKVTIDDDEMGEIADEIEEASAQMWDTAGRIASTPLHHDIILAGMLYDEVHVAIIPTWLMKKKGRRYERVAKRTPYTFEVYNPAQCYARYDRFGLVEHLRYISTTADRILSDYGDLAKGAVADKIGRDIVFLNEYWDETMHAVWIDGSDKSIILDEHGLDFIPIVSTLVYGSAGLFQDNSYDVENHLNQPFLYTLRQSGLWNRQNLALTVAYTQLFSIGSNPMFVYRRNSPDKELGVDWSKPGGIVNLDQGEEFGPLVRNIIDPSMAQMMTLADEKITESTIYKQALGQSMSSGTPYSTVALLNQAGRLPLVLPQKRLSWLLSEVMTIAWRWMRTDRQAYKYKHYDISPSDIPENLEVECQLDVSLPQDTMQNANIAAMLTSGENPIVSQEWVRSNLMHIEDNSSMSKDIWREQASSLKKSLYYQEQLALSQAKMQMELAKMQQQNAPPQQPMPGQGGAEMPPQAGGMPPEVATMPPRQPLPSPGMPQPGGENAQPV